MLKRTPGETNEFLYRLFASDTRISTMLWGPPGVGKSSVVAAAAEQAGLDLIQLEVAVLPPQELVGLPYVDKVRDLAFTKYALPAFWPRSPRGVLVLEDAPHALPSTQALCMSLILDKRVGTHVLPEGWHVVGTGNRPDG